MMRPRPILLRPRRPAGGFAYIAAVILLVVMAGLALAVVRLSATQANTATEAALSARASQAARAGLEWMFYQLRTKNTAGCAGTTLGDFQADTGFKVTLSCSYAAYHEGQNPADGSVVVKNLYQVVAVACNGGAASCPDDASSALPDYTERRRVATVCIAADGSDCY